MTRDQPNDLRQLAIEVADAAAQAHREWEVAHWLAGNIDNSRIDATMLDAMQEFICWALDDLGGYILRLTEAGDKLDKMTSASKVTYERE